MCQGLNILVTGGAVFTSALVLAFAYTSTQDDRGQKATFFIVTIPAQWVPYAMLLMTLMTQGGGAAKVQATGLVAAHLHDFLTRIWPTFGGGRNLILTPGFIRRMFQTTEATTTNRTYGTSFTPAQRAPAPASGSGGVLPESWRSRGSGHRLGGD
jgi:Derlin-2/3